MLRSSLATLYDKFVLRWPIVTLVAIFVLIALIGSRSTDFELDASADSLVLENDKDFRYYRAIGARYASDDFLIIAYTPKADLFSPGSLSDLRELRNRLLEIPRVESVVSILDAPLIDSPRVSLGDLPEAIRTLEDPDTDLQLARSEFLNSPLYRDLVISSDGKTTALQLVLSRDETFHSLSDRRDALREKQLTTALSPQEVEELSAVSNEFKQYNTALLEQESEDIAAVRTIMDDYRDRAELHLGGVLMIASDMVEFIRHDLMVFGVAVVSFVILMLAVSFGSPRWVVLPMLCCLATVVFMFGYLGIVQWRVTVVSSNFTSLLVIITLSLTVHLIVRFRELQVQCPDATQRTLVLETMKSKALPSLYTVLTTIVAFGSLVLSGIRPVIDFGWMMTIGITAGFLLSFTLFPAGLVLLKPAPVKSDRKYINVLIDSLATLIEKHGYKILLLFVAIVLLSAIGISRLTVENRFMDHFKDTTEIYRGMEIIDRKLGGTSPLDIIIDPDADFLTSRGEKQEEDTFEDAFEDESEDDVGLSGTSFWYNTYRSDTVDAIHKYLDELPETGKTLSLSTTMKLFQQLNDDKALDDFTLSLIYKKLPENVKQSLIDPYLSEDGNQIRFAVRLFESNSSLRRNELLQTIRHHLLNNMGFSDEQVHLTGMVVLYNNTLQSLYRSQIETIEVVFLAIMLMFMTLFRSLKLAIIAIIPNLVAAAMVLGLMGWMRIPLDIMTITIAAITVGIAVDNAIHYIHRFLIEIERERDYRAAIRRCHSSVGHAMYYTSITIIIGFSILALSNFVPTIYFGLLTGFAMAVALVANLTLLPILLALFKVGSKHVTGNVATQSA